MAMILYNKKEDYKQQCLTGKLDPCPICYIDFEFNYEADKILDLYETVCKHLFHKACLYKWANNKRTCPKCRGIIPPICDKYEYLSERKMPRARMRQEDNLYIPLLFWFSRDAGLAVPNMALPFNNRPVDLNFGGLDDEPNWEEVTEEEERAIERQRQTRSNRQGDNDNELDRRLNQLHSEYHKRLVPAQERLNLINRQRDQIRRQHHEYNRYEQGSNIPPNEVDDEVDDEVDNNIHYYSFSLYPEDS